MGVMQGRIDGDMERLFREGTLAGMDEGQLLDRFASDRDDRAFAALVERHGPMVLGVCRQLLRDPNDVDDAFQATFLVLVKKAGSLRRTDLLGNWLYGVAYRVALRARSVRHRGETRGTASRGGEAGSPVEQTPDRAEPAADALLRAEERPLIHDEIHRLPRKYQDPVVLCYIEGLTHEEAAVRLGWPVGSVKGRLSRARDLLRSRLVRRGVAVSSAAMAAELVAPDLKAAVPGSLTQSTLKAALAVVSGAVVKGLPLAGSALSPSVTALSEGVIHAMNLSLIRSIVVPILVAGAVTTGGAVAAYQSGGGGRLGEAQPPTPPAAKSTVTKDVKPAAAPGAVSPAQPSQPLAGAASPAAGAASSAASASPPAGTSAVAQPAMGGVGAGGDFGGGGGAAMGGFGGGGGIEATEESSSRVTIARLSAYIATRDKNPRNVGLLKKLDEPVTLSFPTETPLEDILKQIKQVTASTDGKPMPIYVDPVGLQEADKTLTSPVVIDLQDVPLKFSLRLALKQLGLAYCVRDGVLVISSVNGILQELSELQAEQAGSDPNDPFGGMGRMGGMRGGMGAMGGGFR